MIGLFNPWVDGLLILQFDGDVSRIISFRLIVLSTPDVIDATAEDLLKRVHTRFASALSAFEEAASDWSAARGQQGWSELRERLERYGSTMRDMLAEDGAAEYSHARDSLKKAREQLAQTDISPEVENIEALSPVWRRTAIPVWSVKEGDSIDVVLSSSDDPFWLLWLRLEKRAGGDPWEQAVLMDILKTFDRGGGS